MKPKSSASAFSGRSDAPVDGETQTAGETGLDGREVFPPVHHESQEELGLFGVAGPLSDTVDDEVMEHDEPGLSFSSTITVRNADGNIEVCEFAGTSRTGEAGLAGCGTDCDLLWLANVSGSYIMLAAREMILLETDGAATLLRGFSRGNGLECIVNSSSLCNSKSASSSFSFSVQIGIG